MLVRDNRNRLFKVMMGNSPVSATAAFLVTFLLLAAYLLNKVENIEGHYRMISADTPWTELSPGSCIWLVASSLTTIGYGDICPQSHASRAIVILSTFIGWCVNAMFFSLMVNFLYVNRQNILFFEFIF